jgi:hypothetical protein
MMRSYVVGLGLSLARTVAAATAGWIISGVAILLYALASRPDLSVWHLANLDEEFTADSGMTQFKQYLALEDRLFEQLDRLVYDEVPVGAGNAINRYSRGSLSDPGLVEIRWQDMAAAVRLAARHARAVIRNKPLYLVGYSNGGALAVEYTLSTLVDLPPILAFQSSVDATVTASALVASDASLLAAREPD